MRLVGVALLLRLALCGASDASKPHPHSGVFKKLKLGTPRGVGFPKMTRAEAKRLQLSGKAKYTVKVLASSPTSPKGTMRCTSTCYVSTPPPVVWGVLLDLPNYPKFIQGMSSVSYYKRKRTMTGGQMFNARYTIKVGPLYKVVYFLDHHYEPLQKSMVWQLDYARRSDVFDSVGYWHVEPEGTGSIVSYTQDSLLPAWIPRPVKKTFTTVAMRAATAKLEPACLQAVERQQNAGALRMPRALRQLSQRLTPTKE